MKNFWETLKKTGRPILALAPMAGFTDSAFRQICNEYEADVLYSEMASVAALYYLSQKKGSGQDLAEGSATLKLLKFDRRKEKNYVVQVFGSDPEHFAVATRLISEKIKPDGIDLNFGCPVSKIVKQGAGAGLMKDLKRSREAIEAVLKNTTLPVSIKIRSKAGDVDAIKFIRNISDLPIAAVMIHARTLAQGSAGTPDWAIVKELKKYYNGVVLVNGGINKLEEAKAALKESGADGLGLARGILGRPWLFREIKNDEAENWEPKEVFKIALKHAALVAKIKGEEAMIELRKHLVWYVGGLAGAAKIRERLVKISSLDDVKKIFA